MVRSLFLIFIIFACFKVSSQEFITAIDDKVVMPSPSSAKFKKYMGEQPSLSTGAVTVTVPLYTIDCYGLSIPFVYKYQSNGIKVFDDGNPHGYGWSLTPGLRVMRTILGRPDELFDFVDHNSLGSDYVAQQRCMDNSGEVIRPNPIKYDSEHDIFTLCLLDGTHSFILDKEDGFKFKGVGCSEMKVFGDSMLNTITVIDGNGIKYLFGGNAVEKTTNFYKTAWMLNKIIFPNNKNIDFEWEESLHNHNVQILASDVLYDGYVTGMPPEFDRVVTSYQTENRVDVVPYKWFQHLRKVTFPDGTVEIIYAKNAGGTMIDKFVVKNESKVVKSIDFEFLSTTEREEAYLLKEINISDEGTYSFEYNPQRFNKWNMDYWGYSNGTEEYFGYPSLVPKLEIYCSDAQDYYEVGYADKSVNELQMQANMLTSVTYPTGGKTMFEYEVHRFNDPRVFLSSKLSPDCNKRLEYGGGLRVKKMITTSLDGQAPVVRTYKYGLDENGLANCVSVPSLETFYNSASTVLYNNDLEEVRLDIFKPTSTFINSFSNYMDYDIGQNDIWYPEVVEYCDSAQVLGKTKYYFKDHIQRNNIGYDEDNNRIIRSLTKADTKGILKVKEENYKYDAGRYKLTHCLTWNYSLDYSKAHFSSTKIYRKWYSSAGNVEAPDFDENGNAYKIVPSPSVIGNTPINLSPGAGEEIYYISTYGIDLIREKLSSKTETEYFDNGEYLVSELYRYIDDSQLISSVKTVTNDGTSEELTLYYPHTVQGASNMILNDDLQKDIYDKMTEANQISEPVYTTLLRNEDSISSQREYHKYGNDLFLPTKVCLSKKKNNTSMGLYDYNNSGNLISRSKYDGLKESFLWNESGTNPLVYVLGCDYSELVKLYGESIPFITDVAKKQIIYKLRNSFGSKYQISNYDYENLVGLTEESFPNEWGRYYKYDESFRLNGILEKSGSNLSKFSYNVSGERLVATLVCEDKQIRIGDNLSVSSVVSNSSGDNTYFWNIVNSEGKSIYSSKSKQSSLSLRLNDVDSIYVNCSVKDELKNETISLGKAVYVLPEVIGFKNVEHFGRNKVEAKISCLNPVDITFRVMPSIANGRGFFSVGSFSRYITKDSRENTFVVSLTPGTHRVSLSFETDKDSGEIILYPLEIMGTKKEVLDHTSLEIMQ